MIYDHVESINPTFASYFLKPTDVINTFMTEGLEGVATQFKQKGENIKSSIPKDQPSFFEHLGMATQFINKGGKEGIDPEVRKRFDGMTDADVERHHNILKNTDSQDILKIGSVFAN